VALGRFEVRQSTRQAGLAAAGWTFDDHALPVADFETQRRKVGYFQFINTNQRRPLFNGDAGDLQN